MESWISSRAIAFFVTLPARGFRSALYLMIIWVPILSDLSEGVFDFVRHVY